MMNARIHNRDGQTPDDHWYQIEVTGIWPAGRFPNGKPRRQRIDEAALESIVNRFQADRKEAGDAWTGMLVDLDHLSHDLDKTTEAYAWLMDVEIRDGQLYGRLDPTDLGMAAIRNKRVKFFSTEYDPEELEDLGDGTVRPARLAGLAFTNRPNNRGGKPISNRSGDTPGGTKPETKHTMQPIATKLGLPADADEAAILAKLADLMSELETLKGKAAEADADAIMNTYGNRIPKEKRDDVRKRLITNREDTIAMLDLLPEPARDPGAPDRIFNRADANHPSSVGDGNTNAETMRKASAIRNRASEICQRENLPWNQGFARAAAELS